MEGFDLPLDRLFALAALVALVGLGCLVPLYLSQRRDILRLRALTEDKPGYAAEDLARSEGALDRAEVELEDVYAGRGDPVPGTAQFEAVAQVRAGAPATAATEVRREPLVPAAARVTSERPALERLTMERAALLPHPRWRRFRDWVTQPRWLAAIAVVAVVAGVAAIVASQQFLSGDDDGSAPAAQVDSSGLEVAVLSGTTLKGLAGKVGADVEAIGYTLGDIGTVGGGAAEKSLVMFEPDIAGAERLAKRVANDLGIDVVQKIDGQTQRLAGGAAAVVIAGQDRAG